MQEQTAHYIPSEIFIGRQPIYDNKVQVFGYELLFRNNETNRANIIDGDIATSQVIVNTFMELGLDNIVGSKNAFLNLTRKFILGDYPLPFPKDKIIIEVLEDIKAEDKIVTSLNRLSKQGFTIALDDFIYWNGAEPLIEIADIVKIDLLPLNRDELETHVNILSKYKAKLLAEKVETHEDFEFCKDLGFDYFQGYFFCQPNIVKGARLPQNKIALMQLLSKLQDPSSSFQELEQIIGRDVGLSYKILRIINSAHFGLRRKIDSLRQALVILGLQNIRNWASLITLSNLDSKPHELIFTCMARAKMCELFASKLGADDTSSFFTVGLFSSLDALMDRPLEELLAPLPLSDEINQALLERKGSMGDVLNCAIAYEKGDWDNVKVNLPSAEIQNIYLEALGWAKEIFNQLEG
jgi:EAL and modified HD-GYP domain-containing signal transduction protein